MRQHSSREMELPLYQLTCAQSAERPTKKHHNLTDQYSNQISSVYFDISSF